VNNTSIVELKLGQSPYCAEIVNRENSKPFLAISGARKGSNHKGGGIAVFDLRSLDNILNLIGAIKFLEIPKEPTEQKVAFYSEKSRFLSGETKIFDDQWYYRVKVYKNFFIDADGGYVSLKGQGLKPAGFKFFIQEFDFPITKKGKQTADKFISNIYSKVDSEMNNKFNSKDQDFLQKTREMRLLSCGELPWFVGNEKANANPLQEPLLDTVCQFLMDDPYTEQSLAEKLNIKTNLAGSFANPAARYSPEFLAKGIVVERLRGLHGNLEYQATKIPQKALLQSPMLTDLFDEKACGDWASWKKVTFSNDQFPQGRPASLSYAKFEVEAFCGGRAWGVPVDINKARATAIRLFDLLRYFEKQKVGMDEVRALIRNFNFAVLDN
jgi:hypothetical protein